ncbi:MAG TPA: hypothetical protein VL918_07275 [Sphingobium sp.]|nr:hypothetical protein [Sphingobium sp.]
MFEWLKLGLSFQKRVIDAQAKQIDAAQQMLDAAKAQADAQGAANDAMNKLAQQQRAMLNSWFDFWGINH